MSDDNKITVSHEHFVMAEMAASTDLVKSLGIYDEARKRCTTPPPLGTVDTLDLVMMRMLLDHRFFILRAITAYQEKLVQVPKEAVDNGVVDV